MRWNVVALTAVLFLAAILVLAACGGVLAAPDTSATLALGVAQSGLELFEFRGGSTAPVAELKLAVVGRDLGLSAGVLHAFRDDGFFNSQSCVNFGLDLPIARSGPTLFLAATRYYRTGDEWGWCGLRFNLGGR